MKVKYKVSVEIGFDAVDCKATYDVIKTFKGRQNEQNAIDFVNDPRNVRRYGYLYLEMIDEDGKHHTWNQEDKRWEDDSMVIITPLRIDEDGVSVFPKEEAEGWEYDE